MERLEFIWWFWWVRIGEIRGEVRGKGMGERREGKGGEGSGVWLEKRMMDGWMDRRKEKKKFP